MEQKTKLELHHMKSKYEFFYQHFRPIKLSFKNCIFETKQVIKSTEIQKSKTLMNFVDFSYSQYKGKT